MAPSQSKVGALGKIGAALLTGTVIGVIEGKIAVELIIYLVS